MADEYILKHLQDILDAIEELEGFFENYPRRFDVFDCASVLSSVKPRLWVRLLTA